MGLARMELLDVRCEDLAPNPKRVPRRGLSVVVVLVVLLDV